MKKHCQSLLLGFLLILVGVSCTDNDEIIELNPNAGLSYLNIENDGYLIQLKAVPPPQGQKGTWRIYVGENGYFDDVHDPNTYFHGEPGEVYQLGWEVSQGKEYKASVITVSFKPLSPLILSVAPNILYNNVSIELEAVAPRFGASGRWEIVDGVSGRLINSENHITQFIGKEKSSYTLNWILTYGSKEVATELKFKTDVLKAEAGADRLDIKTLKYVVNKFFTLEAILPAGGVGFWQQLDGNGTVHSIDNPASLFQGLADSLYTLVWNVKVDEYESSDTVNLRFRGKWGMWEDERDGQTYRFTEINGLEWLSENYNYAANPGVGSVYYGHAERGVISDGHALELEEERKFYGRLYTLEEAVNSAPTGWRLPTAEEIVNLINWFGGPLYAKESLIVAGRSGLDLNFPGYFVLSSSSDPAFRNVFMDQERQGLFWTSDYSSPNSSAIIAAITNDSEEVGTYVTIYPSYYFPVRYVRNIAK